MKKALLKLTAVVLAFVMFANAIYTVLPFAMDAFNQPANFGVMSDIHYYPEGFVNLNSQKYLDAAYSEAKFMGESAPILRAALETIAVRKANGTYPMDYLLVPGDLTFAGEITGHREIAALFSAFEARTGIQVYVINGNHDVNNYNAVNYALSDDDDPGLITPPETFREIYADFGYTQADSVFVPSTGKAGMLSYAVSLPGGYRLIAIDACKYSADVTKDGLDKKEGGMHLSPALTEWVLGQTTQAALQGETVLGMLHFSLIPHFELQAYMTAGDDMPENHEAYAAALADAGMQYVFTGHVHANDTSSLVSADGNILYDIETAALAGVPNIYREVSLAPAAGGRTDCRLNNVACDAESYVDVSGVSARYGVIERPFSENYCWPMLLGGSIENGVRSDAAEFFNAMFLPEIVKEIPKALPGGLAGLLEENGLDLGQKIINSSPALKTTLAGYNLTAQDFSLFLEAVVKQIDDRYILKTAHTEELLSAAVVRLTRFELAKGSSATGLGKILLLCFEYHMAGDENPADHPEIQAALNALRTQAGADRLVDELLDIVLNDILFNDILPSISLNDLDSLLPVSVMKAIRKVAGKDLTVGGILDKILNTAAKRMNRVPFVHVESGRDLVKALVYTAGYQYLNAGARLQLCSTLADIIESFTTDNDPDFLGDSMAVLHGGSAAPESSVANYRLPVDISVTKGNVSGEAVITWYTIQGVENSDIELSPLPALSTITKNVEAEKITIKSFDFGIAKIKMPRILLKHSVSVSGLVPGTEYTFSAGDSTRGWMSGANVFTVNADGDIEMNNANGENDFFKQLAGFFTEIIVVFKSLNTIVRLFI